LEGGKVKIEEPEYQYMAVYEFESYEIMQEALNSGKLGESVKEYKRKVWRWRKAPILEGWKSNPFSSVRIWIN